MEKRIVDALELIGSTDLPADQYVTRTPSPEHQARRRLFASELAGVAADEERALQLALKGLVTPQRLAAEQLATSARRSKLEAELQRLDTHVALPQQVTAGIAAQSLRDLTPLLRSQNTRLEDKVEALRHLGLRRLYVDGPLVRIELLD